MIDEHVRVIAEMKAQDKATDDQEHTLDVMIKIKAAHVAYKRKIEAELQELGGGPTSKNGTRD